VRPNHLTKTIVRMALTTGFVLLIAALRICAADAQSYDVSLDTSGLTSGDTYGIQFQLSQGGSSATIPPPFSSVTVSNFLDPGGSVPDPTSIAGPNTYGNYTGNLSTSVNLTTANNSAFNGFQESFTPGSSVSFNVDATGLLPQDPAALSGDQFTFSLYDTTANTTVESYDGTYTDTGSGALFTVSRDTSGNYLTQTDGYLDGNGILHSASIPSPAPAPELSTSISFGLLLTLFVLGATFKPRRKPQPVTVEHDSTISR